MNDWLKKLFGISAPNPKPRNVDVEDLIAALDALEGDPITSGFSVSHSGVGSMRSETCVLFADVAVAFKVLGWGWGESGLTKAGKALGDDMMQLMQAIIDKHQTMKALEAPERVTRARKALNEAKASLAEK